MLTLCVGVPSSSEVSHHLTGGQVTVEVLMGIKRRLTWSLYCSSLFVSLFQMWPLLTMSSRTLLDTATLKGWNLLMAEKADSSTSVCGSLRTTSWYLIQSNSLLRSCKTALILKSQYLAASLVPKVQYLTGILSLSALRETTTSGGLKICFVFFKSFEPHNYETCF